MERAGTVNERGGRVPARAGRPRRPTAAARAAAGGGGSASTSRSRTIGRARARVPARSPSAASASSGRPTPRSGSWRRVIRTTIPPSAATSDLDPVEERPQVVGDDRLALVPLPREGRSAASGRPPPSPGSRSHPAPARERRPVHGRRDAPGQRRLAQPDVVGLDAAASPPAGTPPAPRARATRARRSTSHSVERAPPRPGSRAASGAAEREPRPRASGRRDPRRGARIPASARVPRAAAARGPPPPGGMRVAREHQPPALDGLAGQDRGVVG